MKTLLMIYNPHAGRQRISRQLAQVIHQFSAAGYLVTAHPTLYHGDAVEVAAAEGWKYDHVVCCGGDGTLNEVAAGLITHPEHIPTLGYLPAGTTNDFSKTLGLPSNLLQSARLALEGSPVPCDLGEFNGRPFLYVAGFGVFTEVSYTTPRGSKFLLGHLAYVLEGIKSLNQLKGTRVKVTHDGETLEDTYIYGMVSDSVSVGGFRGIREEAVKLDDGVFEVMLVRKPHSMEELGSILNALRRKTPDGNVVGFQSGDITFESETPLAWTLDGEFGGDVQHAHILNRPKVLQIMRGVEP